jgi:K+-transporting ATPase ATPase A chain
VDFACVIYRVLLPVCLLLALVYVWQGMPQTLGSEAVATTLEGVRQHIGTHGEGFHGMNAAHPFILLAAISSPRELHDQTTEMTRFVTMVIKTMLEQRTRHNWLILLPPIICEML